MLFFQKLNKANYVFCKRADSSLIAKVIFLDIEAVGAYLGAIPTLITAPISLVVFLIFIGINIDIGYDVWIIFAVFAVAAFFILIFHYVIIVKRRDMDFTSSVRMQLLTEMIPNMINVKLHSLENFFKNKFDENRKNELKNTKIVYLFTTLMQFCFYISPLVASVCAIAVYNRIHPEKLEVSQAYFIIIIIRNL
jgi:ABC-type bacteriocin/lantibiotic exporter with double-glycine peptidase domain